MKLVPALYDTENDLALAECNAILRYISQKFKIDEQWYPREDLAKQAKINQYLDFHHLNTRRCSYLAFHLLFAPILKTGDPTFDEKHTYRTVRSALRNFEGIYLQDKKFIGGDKPCIADLVAFFDITMLEVLDFDYAKVRDLTFDQVFDYLDESHTETKRFFESLITPGFRQWMRGAGGE